MFEQLAELHSVWMCSTSCIVWAVFRMQEHNFEFDVQSLSAKWTRVRAEIQPMVAWAWAEAKLGLRVRQGLCDGQENEGHRHWRGTRLDFLPADADLKGRVRTVFESVDLTLLRFCVWVGRALRRQGGWATHHPHAILTQHLLSVCTLDVTWTVMTHMHIHHVCCTAHCLVRVWTKVAHRTQSRYTANMVAERCWILCLAGPCLPSECGARWQICGRVELVGCSLNECGIRWWSWREVTCGRQLATVSVCLWRSETAELWNLFELSTLACDPTRSRWKTQYERWNSRWIRWWLRMRHLKLSCWVNRTVHKVLQNCLERSRQCWIVHKHQREGCLLTRKAWESHQCSRAEKKTSTCGPKKVENYVSGVCPNVRGALSFAVESHDAVTATSVALGVPELEAGLSTEIDGKLFMVLSAFTDGQSFVVVMSAGGDHGFESWRKLHRR